MENIKSQIATICVVDDEELFNEVICGTLRHEGYKVLSFASAAAFLKWNATTPEKYDLILTDVSMPGESGFELCKSVRTHSKGERVPIIMVTGSCPDDEKSQGIDAGADDFIQKPFNKAVLLAKIKSLLSIRAKSLERIEKLSRFVSPNVADMMVSESQQLMLHPHRAYVSVMFIDLRGFTAFSEEVEPEEVLAVLNEYYTIVGNACLTHKATLGHLAGDGIMLFFNDPVPIDGHQEAAVRLALEVREALVPQRKIWHERSYKIDFGIGIAEGYATIGQIGFDRFSQYTVIGPVANFAARLCSAAAGGQILVSDRYLQRLPKGLFATEALDKVSVKGYADPVKTNNILSVAEDGKKVG